MAHLLVIPHRRSVGLLEDVGAFGLLVGRLYKALLVVDLAAHNRLVLSGISLYHLLFFLLFLTTSIKFPLLSTAAVADCLKDEQVEGLGHSQRCLRVRVILLQLCDFSHNLSLLVFTITTRLLLSLLVELLFVFDHHVLQNHQSAVVFLRVICLLLIFLLLVRVTSIVIENELVAFSGFGGGILLAVVVWEKLALVAWRGAVHRDCTVRDPCARDSSFALSVFDIQSLDVVRWELSRPMCIAIKCFIQIGHIVRFNRFRQKL